MRVGIRVFIVVCFVVGIVHAQTPQKKSSKTGAGAPVTSPKSDTPTGASFYEDVGSSTAVREKVVNKPIFKTGLSLDQIASCLVIDQIPWISRKTNRKSRLLARDKMRLNIHKTFSTWEIHQVMDSEGYISFIFRRTLADGRVESIVAKENHYNRYIDSGSVRKIVQVENFINLIDRATMIFYAENGNRAEFRPGFTGQSTFVIYYTGQTPPVYLQDLKCSRGDSEGGDPFAPAGGGESESDGGGAAPAAGS